MTKHFHYVIGTVNAPRRTLARKLVLSPSEGRASSREKGDLDKSARDVVDVVGYEVLPVQEVALTRCHS